MNDNVWKKLYQDNSVLLYEGFTFHDKPCGSGTSFFANGNKYQEGVFDVKGLVCGREYYPNGRVRFEGLFRVNTGYGPNPPIYGKCYNHDGEKIFEGRLCLHYGGVGYPTVTTPQKYGPIVQLERPEIRYLTWADQIRIKRGGSENA